MPMAASEAEWIWKDGEFIRWADATVHILSIAVQFGSSVFEGIRCYQTPRGPAVFRLPEHLRRLKDSCRIYRLSHDYSDADLLRASCAVVRKNALGACYIRPMVLRGYGTLSMDATGKPIEVYIPAWPWGAYLGEESLTQGVDVCVSTWARAAPNTFPGMAKAAGHYNNAQLIKLEALARGCAEAIALTPQGVISEGSGQNLFAVRDGEVLTPPIEGSNLMGITRASVLTICADLAIPVREAIMPREFLYVADELFFAGTATEVTPIRSVDEVQVGEGRIGLVTEQIQTRFLGITRGEIDDDHGWLSYVEGN